MSKQADAKGFVKKERKKGYPDEAIMRAMLDAGWKAGQISAALANPKLPEHVVKRNVKGTGIQLSKAVTSVHWTAWLSFFVCMAWLAYFFRPDGGPAMLIGGALLVLILGFLFLYEHFQKEWMLRISMMFNASLFAVSLFFVYAWLVSFLLAPMREQLLLLTLLPGLLVIFFAQEFSYHFWIHEHGKHTVRRRAIRAVVYSLINFVIIFVVMACMTGLVVEKFSQRSDKSFAAMEQATSELQKLAAEKSLPIYDDVAEIFTVEHTAVSVSKGEIFMDFLLVRDVTATTRPMLEQVRSDLQISIEGSVYIAPLRQADFDYEFFVARGYWYDNTTTPEAHLDALQQGNTRLMAALDEIPEQESGSAPLSILTACVEGQYQDSLGGAAFVRYRCASKLVNDLFALILQISTDITEFKNNLRDNAVWSSEQDEPLESAIIRNEMERKYLQDQLMKKLEKQVAAEQREAIAIEHWQDPYLGIVLCLYLPDGSECFNRYALAYNKAYMCEPLAADERSCRAAVVEKEAAVLNSDLVQKSR